LKSNDAKFLELRKVFDIDNVNTRRQKEYEKFFIVSVTKSFPFILYIVDIYNGRFKCWFM